MNQKNIGIFIAQLRKEKGLTQEELACILSVNNKTISRWENGVTMPDLSLLQTISKELGITVTELLNGRRMNKQELLNLKNTINELLTFHTKENKDKLNKTIKLIKTIITTIFTIAIFICLLCDYLINNTFSWSLIVLTSIVFSWIIIIPFTNNKNYIKTVLLKLTIFLIPFLWSLSQIIENTLILKIGSITSILSLTYIWIIYLLFKHVYRKKRSLTINLAILLLIPLELSINLTISYFINLNIISSNNFLNIFILLIILLLCNIINKIISSF